MKALLYIASDVITVPIISHELHDVYYNCKVQ